MDCERAGLVVVVELGWWGRLCGAQVGFPQTAETTWAVAPEVPDGPESTRCTMDLVEVLAGPFHKVFSH